MLNPKGFSSILIVTAIIISLLLVTGGYIVFNFIKTSKISQSNQETEQLPSPPNGFIWQECKNPKMTLLKPDGWFFYEEEKENLYGCFISKEDINKSKEFKTGLSVNVQRNISQRSNIKPSQYIKQFIEGMDNLPNIKALEPVEKLNNFPSKFQAFRRILLTTQPDGTNLAMIYLTIANDTTDTAYIIWFESPQDQFEDDWNKYGETMFDLFKIDDEV